MKNWLVTYMIGRAGTIRSRVIEAESFDQAFALHKEDSYYGKKTRIISITPF